MNIAIDIRSTLRKIKTGIGRYTFNLIDALSQLDKENRYLLYSRKKIIDFKRRLPRVDAPNFRHCVDYFNKGPGRVLPNVDIFHTSSYDLDKPANSRFMVTVHDVIHKAYPHGHTQRTIKDIDTMLNRTLASADLVIADSSSTKYDLMRFYDVPDSKIQVIYPGVDPLFLREPDDIVARDDYILFVGTLEPRKNIDGLIRAFSWLKKEFRVPHRLYIVGKKGWMFEKIFRAYEESGVKEDIIFKYQGVDDMELKRLYRRAALFVYPSFYEGFGLPIVEAFASDTPVITSKVSSCGEIASDSALLIDPLDHNAMAEAMLKLINDSELRKDLVKKGRERLNDFRWDKAAQRFLSLCKY